MREAALVNAAGGDCRPVASRLLSTMALLCGDAAGCRRGRSGGRTRRAHGRGGCGRRRLAPLHGSSRGGSAIRNRDRGPCRPARLLAGCNRQGYHQERGEQQPRAAQFLVPFRGRFVKPEVHPAAARARLPLHIRGIVILWRRMGESERILEHLENDYTEPIRDPVWKHIYVSRPLLQSSSRSSSRSSTASVSSAPPSLVYPGATHTRRSHSLGVFHLARRMITTLVRKNRDVAITHGRRQGLPLRRPAARHRALSLCPFAEGPAAWRRTSPWRPGRSSADFAPVIRGSLGVEPEAVAAIIDRARGTQGR